MTTVIRSFDSEDDAGVLPEVMAALNREALKTPRTSCFTYDDASHGFERLLKEIFTPALDDPSPSVYFVYNAAAANMLSILFCTQPHDVVICSNVSRLILDESFSAVMGSDVKLLTVPINENGKISMDTLEKNLDEIITMHQNQVKMLTISQPSEYGTVYTVSELKQLSNTAKKYGLYFHIDGARLFNAASSLNCELRDITTLVNADILSLGGAKAGLMYGEAVIVFNQSLVKIHAVERERSTYRYKQIVQLISDQRFISIQFLTLLRDNFWKKSSDHSNSMALLLKSRLEELTKSNDSFIRITKPVETNVVFLEVSNSLYEKFSNIFSLYMRRGNNSEVRLVCSFDTTENDIANLINQVKEVLEK